MPSLWGGVPAETRQVYSWSLSAVTPETFIATSAHQLTAAVFCLAQDGLCSVFESQPLQGSSGVGKRGGGTSMVHQLLDSQLKLHFRPSRRLLLDNCGFAR